MHRLVEAGLLNIDLPIAHYWPEFGCNGKEGITTRMVLSHQAGLAAVDGELTLQQVLAWDRYCQVNWPKLLESADEYLQAPQIPARGHQHSLAMTSDKI